MNGRIPDKFIILHHAKLDLYSIFSGWNGSYMDADTWRRSSPIKEIIKHEDYFEAKTSSSTYILRLERLGYTNYMAAIFQDHKSEESGVNVIDDIKSFEELVKKFIEK